MTAYTDTPKNDFIPIITGTDGNEDDYKLSWVTKDGHAWLEVYPVVDRHSIAELYMSSGHIDKYALSRILSALTTVRLSNVPVLFKIVPNLNSTLRMIIGKNGSGVTYITISQDDNDDVTFHLDYVARYQEYLTTYNLVSKEEISDTITRLYVKAMRSGLKNMYVKSSIVQLTQ